MKKLNTVLFLSMATLLIGVPAYGMQEQAAPVEQGRIAKMGQSTAHAIRDGKRKAMKQLDESVARFKKCLHGDCTKMEALKVARDVTLAVGAAIAASYVTGGVMKRMAQGVYEISPEEEVQKEVEVVGMAGYKPNTMKIAAPIYRAGEMMQKPAEAVGRAAWAVGKTAIRPIYKLREGDKVMATIKGSQQKVSGIYGYYDGKPGVWEQNTFYWEDALLNIQRR